MNNLIKKVEIIDLYDVDVEYLKDLFCDRTYPWEVLPNIGSYISKLIETGIPGFTKLSENVLVGENVKIASTVTIEGKCIIGPNTEIRPGAYIRGNVITGPDCVIGNSSELKNAVLLRHVQVPHYNYVGDSILGNNSHMGAGSICSNLRSDGKNVIIHGDKEYETGLRKIGAFIADKGDVGCGCVLNPGTIIGKSTTIYPLTSVRGVMPEGAIVKSMDNIVLRK
ncbi:MAG: UDP-N-acetylglucosamine pyrophosphorylase [Clostridia bacterium]|nr:UDP-N-acetylglucosamine pyrophosphorylase [Clostridia bacterium]